MSPADVAYTVAVACLIVGALWSSRVNRYRRRQADAYRAAAVAFRTGRQEEALRHLRRAGDERVAGDRLVPWKRWRW